jgi:hypothetical protein
MNRVTLVDRPKLGVTFLLECGEFLRLEKPPTLKRGHELPHIVTEDKLTTRMANEQGLNIHLGVLPIETTQRGNPFRRDEQDIFAIAKRIPQDQSRSIRNRRPQKIKCRSQTRQEL